MQHGIKPFAPFGEIFHQYRLLNISIEYCPYIFCGQFAFGEARRIMSGGQLCLVLPLNTQVTDYRWSVADLSLILFDTGGITSHQLKKTAYLLLKENAKQVCVYYADPPGVEIFNLREKGIIYG